jgi:hypothetical protein
MTVGFSISEQLGRLKLEEPLAMEKDGSSAVPVVVEKLSTTCTATTSPVKSSPTPVSK